MIGVHHHAIPEEAEELWTEDGSEHVGWFCVRTDPFPCPAPDCGYVAEFMTAAHLVLVWEERDDPNLLRHAQRAVEVGRNPHVVGYEADVRAERVVLRVGSRRPARARRPRQVECAALVRRPAWSLGVEEELMLVDAETLLPARDGWSRVFGEATDRIKQELFESLVEITTPVVETAEEIEAELRALRHEVAERAAEHGLAVIAVALSSDCDRATAHGPYRAVSAD